MAGPGKNFQARPLGFSETGLRRDVEVAAYSVALAQRVAAAIEDGGFALVLGGDCSIVLGCLLGARARGPQPVGLAYVGAHADFGTPEESRTGSVASMCLALAVGRGETPLARLADGAAVARAQDVVLIGRRNQAEPWYGHAALRASPVLDLQNATIRERGPDAVARCALERLARPGSGGFWIHVDTDVLDPSFAAAVDSPTPGGLDGDGLLQLLSPLVRHPRARGMELTIYDPQRDPSRICAARLANLLEDLLGGDASVAMGTMPARTSKRWRRALA